MQRAFLLTVPIVCALVNVDTALAQRGIGDWTTSGYDAQRSHWVRNDAKISLESMRTPGFMLEWKLKLQDGSAAPTFASPPVMLDFYIGYRGFRSLGFVGLGSNDVAGMDTDLGRFEWRSKVGTVGRGAVNSACPGGLTSGLARISNIAYPALPSGRSLGRGNPAKSGVGEPHEGAVTLKVVRPAGPPPAPPPTASPTARRTTPAPNPFAPRAQYVYAISSDGKFHSLYVSNGEEPKPSVAFLGANANAVGLTVFDNQAYAATTNDCGGVENGVWVLDLESQKVSHWKSTGKSVAGTVGPAIGPDGTIYAAAGSELVGLEERTLKPKGSYSISGQEFNSSPVVFEFKGKDMVAVTANDGKVHLLDGANLSKAVATSAPSSSPAFPTGALASWQDLAGTRWILVPTANAVAAWKVVEQNGAVTLQSGWTSRELVSPLTPIIVNGVVFALSSGNAKTPAVLFALDSATGKDIWNSGKNISTFARRGGLAAGGSRVYIATQDGMQYVFGFPIEH